jgi:hypothetical protein
MAQLKPIRIIGLVFIFCAFVGSYLFATWQIDGAMAAGDEGLWVDEGWNILTLVPDGWEWIEDYDEGIPVVFVPEDEEDEGIPDFIFVTYLGKQSGQEIEKLKTEYIKALEKDLDEFKLNSAEKVTTEEGLEAYDLSYTFTEDRNVALGYDRIVFTSEDIFWAISFSAGKHDFKRLKDGAMSIIDSFIFDAAEWLEEKQDEE